MRLHRCLLIACVTLSQACDSKDAAPTAAPVVTKVAAVVIDDTGTTVDGVRGAPIEAEAIRLQIAAKRRASDAFDVLHATPKLARVELVVDGVTAAVRFDKVEPDGPGMQVHLVRTGEVMLVSTSGREGTAERPLVVTKLDEPGRNARRASLAEIKTRTKATRIDIVVDRVQPMSAVIDVVTTLRSAGYDVRLVAGAPSGSTMLGMSIDGPPNIGGLLADSEKTLQHCFEEALRRDGPIAELTIELSIVVGTAGNVSESKVGTSQDMSAELFQCLTSTVLAWKLPAPPGPYQFTINFRAR